MGPLELTTQERILLYLSDFRDVQDRYEFPQALTQSEIARAVGVERKHISRYLKRLVDAGALEERKARVEGKRQRMLVYCLDRPGWTQAIQLKQFVGRQRVPVEMEGDVREMTLGEIDDSTTAHLTFSDIIREAMGAEVLRMEDLERIEERRARSLDQRALSIEAYARALMAVWRDGRVSATERLLMEEIRQLLEVAPKEHARLEAEIVEQLANRTEDAGTLYRRVYGRAMEEGVSREAGREVLEILRRELGLSRREVEALEGRE